MSILKQEVYQVVKKDETVLNGYDAANPNLEGAIFQCNYNALDYSPENFLGADGGTTISSGDLLRWTFTQESGAKVTKSFIAQNDYELVKALPVNTSNGETTFSELVLFEDNEGSLYKSGSKYFTRNFTVYSSVNLVSDKDFDVSSDLILADSLVRITSGGFKVADAIGLLYTTNAGNATVADVVFANYDGLRRFEGEPSYFGSVDETSIVPNRTWFYYNGESTLGGQLNAQQAAGIGAGFFFNNTGANLDFSDISAGSAGSTGNIATTTGSTGSVNSIAFGSPATASLVFNTTGNTDVLNGQDFKIDSYATFDQLAGYFTNGRSGNVDSSGTTQTAVAFTLTDSPIGSNTANNGLFNGYSIQVTYSDATSETKTIQSFDGITNIATLSGQLSAVPQAGDSIRLIYPNFTAENVALIGSVTFDSANSTIPSGIAPSLVIFGGSFGLTSDVTLEGNENALELVITADGVSTISALGAAQNFSVQSGDGSQILNAGNYTLELGDEDETVSGGATLISGEVETITFTGGVADVPASDGMGAIYADQATIDQAADEGSPITSYVLAGDTGGIQVLLVSSSSISAANVDDYSNLIEGTEYSSQQASNSFWTEQSAFGSPVVDIEDPTAATDATDLSLIDADDLTDSTYWDKISENFVEDQDLSVGATGVDGANTGGSYSGAVTPRPEVDTYQTIEVVSRINGTATDNMLLTTVIKHGIPVGTEVNVALSGFTGANGAEINSLTAVKAKDDKTLEVLNTSDKVVDVPSASNYPLVTKTGFTNIVWEQVDLPTTTQALIYKA
jgi:hypothetical protein